MQVKVPNCPSAYSAAYLEAQTSGNNLTLCTDQEKNLDGSAIALYNDTTYYDDLIFAATWLYKASGDNAYLTDAEAFYVKYLYSSVSPGWLWAASCAVSMADVLHTFRNPALFVCSSCLHVSSA